jgi:hypothetical protein
MVADVSGKRSATEKWRQAKVVCLQEKWPVIRKIFWV